MSRNENLAVATAHVDQQFANPALRRAFRVNLCNTCGQHIRRLDSSAGNDEVGSEPPARWNGSKSGTFYFAKKRKFLLCVDTMTLLYNAAQLLVLASLTRSLVWNLKSKPVVPEELGKSDRFATENLLNILSHGGSLSLAIQPLQIKQSVRVPLRDARS